MPPAQQTLSVLDPEEVLKPWRKWLRRTGRAKSYKTRESYQQYVMEITLQVPTRREGGREGRRGGMDGRIVELMMVLT
jgi:hypothetical protein